MVRVLPHHLSLGVLLQLPGCKRSVQGTQLKQRSKGAFEKTLDPALPSEWVWPQPLHPQMRGTRNASSSQGRTKTVACIHLVTSTRLFALPRDNSRHQVSQGELTCLPPSRNRDRKQQRPPLAPCGPGRHAAWPLPPCTPLPLLWQALRRGTGSAGAPWMHQFRTLLITPSTQCTQGSLTSTACPRAVAHPQLGLPRHLLALPLLLIALSPPVGLLVMAPGGASHTLSNKEPTFPGLMAPWTQARAGRGRWAKRQKGARALLMGLRQ